MLERQHATWGELLKEAQPASRTTQRKPTQRSQGDQREPRARGNCPSNRSAGWVARTRPLAGPLSPRGSQPVLSNLRSHFASPNGSTEPTPEYAGCSTKVSDSGPALFTNSTVTSSGRSPSSHLAFDHVGGGYKGSVAKTDTACANETRELYRILRPQMLRNESNDNEQKREDTQRAHREPKINPDISLESFRT